MAITVSTLEGLDPYAFHSLGFHASMASVAEASRYFDSDVGRVVQDGHAWTGEGQPQAAVVMATNSIALETAALQIKAGVAATDGLVTALVKARRWMAELRAEKYQSAGIYGGSGEVEESYTMHLAEDGTVTWTRPTELGLYGDTTIEDTALTQRAKQILTYAEFADLTAAGLLQRITNACPTFTDDADQKALTYNAAVYSLAVDTALAAKLSEAMWDQYTYDKWQFDPTDLDHEAFELFLQVRGGATSYGPGLVGAGATAFSLGLPIVWTPVGFVSVVGGALTVIGGGALTIYDTITGDDSIENGPPGIEDPTDLLAVTPDVEDEDLQGILDDLYLDADSPPAEAGFPTVAHAAALQRAGVGLPEDYLNQAREVRDRLDDWLDSSYDELDDDTAPRYQQVEASDGSTTQTYTVEVPRTLEYYDPEDFAISPEERQLARQYRNQLNALLGDR